MSPKSGKRTTAFDVAVNAIGEFIIGNKMKTGDTLLPEPELAAKLGISRNVVREALRHYRTLGIIESRPKIGTVICSLLPRNPYAGYFPFLASQTDILPKLLELRISLETGAIPLLLQYVDDEHIRKLYQYCEQMQTAKTMQKLNQLDCDFHIQLLELTQNPLLIGLLPLTVHFFTKSLEISVKKLNIPEERASNYKHHIAITSALEKRDTDALRQAFDRHYATYKLQ